MKFPKGSETESEPSVQYVSIPDDPLPVSRPRIVELFDMKEKYDAF
jgi:hypothetical protein